MPQTRAYYQSDLAGGKVHLHKTTKPPCPNGKCRLGPTVHLSKTATESHSAILHGLDRKVGRLYFGTDPFSSTIDAWNGTPLVFAQSHPEPRDFTKDPDSELDRINGAIIGESSDAFIEGTGHPKLMITKNYTDATALRMFGQGLITEEQLKKSQAAVPIALKLLAEGKLSHSSAFICPDDGEKLTGTVIPNHILEFEETERDQPVDRMAVVLNKKENENVTLQSQEPAAHINAGKVMSGKNAARLKGILDGIATFFEDMMGAGSEPAPNADEKKNAISVVEPGITVPNNESLEGQIETIRTALNDKIGLRYPDGMKRTVWTVMTLPDSVIWQNPDTAQYYSTPYTLTGENVTFGDPVEVEQAYVVKQANTVFTNMTKEDIENITRRNKMADPIVEDPKVKELSDQVAKLNKEIETANAVLKAHEDAKAQMQKEKFDADWANLEKTVIPHGEIKDPADKAHLQKMSTEDPLAFAVKVAGWKSAPKMGEEGSAHMNKGGDGTDHLAASRELRQSTGRITRR
jgi:hypothetical protein